MENSVSDLWSIFVFDAGLLGDHVRFSRPLRNADCEGNEPGSYETFAATDSLL